MFVMHASLRHWAESRELLGSVIGLEIVDETENKVKIIGQRAFEEVKRIEKAFSRFLATSELSILNQHCGEKMAISAELFELIAFGLQMQQDTDGAFNLTIHSALEQLGYDASYSFTPQSKEAALGTIVLEPPHFVTATAAIDLGGLGKGYALDCMDNVLTDLENFCIDAGGDLGLKGVNPEGNPWRVAFEHPLEKGQAIGYVDVPVFQSKKTFFFAASNGQKRKWAHGHHLIDPRTLRPAENMLAVYVQGSSGMLVDSYATALFVMGFEKASALIGKIPVEFMLVSPHGKILKSSGFLGEVF